MTKGESEFTLPAAAVLLQFWHEKIKNEFRIGTFWPEEPRSENFETRYWMWGHTTSHLIHVMYGFGWTVDHGEVAR